jgi:hypothetical protein
MGPVKERVRCFPVAASLLCSSLSLALSLSLSLSLSLAYLHDPAVNDLRSRHHPVSDLLHSEDRRDAALLQRDGEQRVDLSGVSGRHGTQTDRDGLVGKLVQTNKKRKER